MTGQEKTLTGPVSGLLHVKVPALGNKRGLPTWKVWKDFWVTAKGVCGGGLQLSVSPIKLMHSEGSAAATVLLLPAGSSVRRTVSRSKPYVFAVFPAAVFLAGRSESETQRWMSDFARFLDPHFITESDSSQFEVTTLPGPLCSSLGLSGVMGRLGVRSSGVALRESSRRSDPQGRVLGAWGWRQIDHARCRLAAAALPEDDGKICVIRTTSLFPGGAGDLTVFCSKGRQLVRCLQNKTANLITALTAQHRARRMSRSEGDLSAAFAEVARKHPAAAASFPHKKQLASSLVSMGMRLAVPGAARPRCHSSAHCEQDEDEQAVGRPRCHSAHCSRSEQSSSSSSEESGCCPGDDEEEEEDSLLDELDENFSGARRVSNVSVASGVYETIDDSDAEDQSDQGVARPLELTPPPLPPRQYKQPFRRRHRGGLHAFFKIQRLWRSSSDGHVAREEEEEEEDVEVIYSELVDPAPSSELAGSSSSLTSTPITIPRGVSQQQHEDSVSSLGDDNEADIEDEESIYLPMSRSYDKSRFSSSCDQNRLSSESGVSVRTLDSFTSASNSCCDESVYVSMSSSDRKASLTSEIYALVTGIEPPSCSGP